MRRKEVWSLTALCAYQLQGTLRVILEPLLMDKPFIGAVTVFFLHIRCAQSLRNAAQGALCPIYR